MPPSDLPSDTDILDIEQPQNYGQERKAIGAEAQLRHGP